jgi:peroxiredoxin family protein
VFAVVLESGDLQRLSTGLSLLVSAAAEGEEARALVTFGALAPLLDEALLDRARAPGAAPDVADVETFAQTLVALRDTARELPALRMFACAGALEATGVERSVAVARLDGVMSTPRFLREVAGASLVVV